MASTLPTAEAPAPAPDTPIRASGDVLFRELAGEAVLLDLRSESYFGLDPVGTRMWQALVEHGSLRGALGALEGVWDVEPARLRRDLEALVAELAAQGLVVIGAP